MNCYAYHSADPISEVNMGSMEGQG